MEQLWRRSTRCATNACIEIAEDATTYFVRDSKELDGPVLRFGLKDWQNFIDTLK